MNTSAIGDHIDQSPKLQKASETTLAFELPKRDWRLDKTVIYVVVQDYNESIGKLKVFEELNLRRGIEGLCNSFGNTWIALKMLVSTFYEIYNRKNM